MKRKKTQKQITRKKRTYFLLFCIFLLPITVILIYAFQLNVLNKLYFAALLPSIAGLCAGFLVLNAWEKKMRDSVGSLVKEQCKNILINVEPSNAPLSLQGELSSLNKRLEESSLEYEHRIERLKSECNARENEIQKLNRDRDKKLEQMRLAYLEFEDLRAEYHRLEDELFKFKEETQGQLNHKESLINEYQRTISEQRIILEKKQRTIAKLDDKVNDLMYEIKSLLQLEDDSQHKKGALGKVGIPSYNEEKKFPTFDLSSRLQNYVSKAEKLTGLEHIGYLGGKSPRFLDLTSRCYAIDQRRLDECFSEEGNEIVFLFSFSEKKFLYVSNHVKTLLGYSSEKFMKEFDKIAIQGLAHWQASITAAFMAKESNVQIALQGRSAKVLKLDCMMSCLAKGPFAGNLLGVFFPQDVSLDCLNVMD